MDEHLGSAWVAIRAKMSTFAQDLAAGKADATKKLADLGSHASEVGKMFTVGLTTPIVAGFGLSAKAAIDFESSFAGVRKTVDGSEAELAAISDQFRRLAQEIPVSVHELNAIGESAGALGIKKENIVDFTKTMAALGVTTDLTSAQAADAFARIANVMELPQDQFENMASAVVALGNNGASTESQIVSMATNIAGAGKQVGLSTAEVLGFSSALASVGIEAEAGGSAISKVFMDIATAVADGGGMLEEFARVAGKPVEEFAEKFRTDAAGATADFIVGLRRLKDEGENVFGVLDGLALRDIRVQRALLNASGAGKLFVEQLELGKKAFEENTALAEEAEKRYSTVASELVKLKNVAYEAAITFGESMLPVIRDMVPIVKSAGRTIGDAAKLFAELPAPVRNATFAAAAFAAAIGPVLFIGGQLATSVSTLIGAFMAFGGAGGVLTVVAGSVTVVTGKLLALAPQLVAVSAALWGVTKVVEAGGILWDIYKTKQEDATRATFMAAIEQKNMAKASEIAGRAITSVDEANQILAQHHKKVAEEAKAAAAANEAAGRAAADAAKPTKDYTAELAAAQKAARELSPAQRANIDALLALGDSADKVAEKLKLSEPVVRLYKESKEAAAKAAEKHAKELEKEKEKLQELLDTLSGAKALKDATAIVNVLTQNGLALKLTKDEAKQYADQLAKVIEKHVAMREQANPQLLEMTILLDAIATKGEDAATGIKLLADSLEKVKLQKPVLASTAIDLGAFMAPLKAAVKPGITQGIGDKILGDLGETIRKQLGPTIVAAFAGGGSVLQSAGALLGNSLGESLASHAGKAISGFFGQKLGGMIGSALGPLGAMLGGKLGELAGKVFGKLFGGNSEHKKVNDLRDKFVEAAGGIHELNVKAHAAGLTLDRFLKAKTVREYEAAIHELNAAFEELEERNRRNAESANSLFEQIMEMGANGVPASFQPAIEQLIALGLLTDEQAAKLRGLGEAAGPSLEQLEESARALGVEIETLGPAFAQQKLDKEAEALYHHITRLIGAGADWGSTMMASKEELADLVTKAKKGHLVLSESLRPYIEDLIKSGNLVDENGDKITDLAGITWGPEMKTEAEIAEEGWNKILEAIQALIAEIRGPLMGAIDDIPDEKRIKVGYEYDGELPNPEHHTQPEEYDPPAMAKGGIVTRSMLVNAGEAGPEAIVPLDRLADMFDQRPTIAAIEKQNGLLVDITDILGNLDRVLAVAMRDALEGRV